MTGILAVLALALPSQGTLPPLFAKPRADPAAVVPLILAASQELAGAHGAKESRVLADTLEPFCRRAFFGPERLPGMEKLGLVLHTVRAGEVPERIAKRYRVGAG